MLNPLLKSLLNEVSPDSVSKARPAGFDQPIAAILPPPRYPGAATLGEFEVGGVLCEKPKDLWERTKEASGITREFFDSYFDGREQAMAIAVKNPKRYATPKSLKDVSGSLTPPQSFQYLAAEAES